MKKVQLVEYSGRRKIYGFRGLVDGDIDEERVFRPMIQIKTPPLKHFERTMRIKKVVNKHEFKMTQISIYTSLYGPTVGTL